MKYYVTSNIEHARNFIKLNGVYVEKSSIQDEDNGYVHHTHCCEIELLHKKHKEYWKKYCPRKKKPNKKFWAGMENECDNCNHSITIEFFKDNGGDVRIRSVHRQDDLPEWVQAFINKDKGE